MKNNFEIRAKLTDIVTAKLKEGCPDDHIIAFVEAAGRDMGASTSTISRVLLEANLRRRAVRTDCGMQKPKDPAIVEAEVKSLLSSCSKGERVTILARLTRWAAGAG
ncbi:MAG: hypothetical protein DVB22_001288 [Verrucomicrobia bacterium]|nr:MAG: hypothetical protein DVB22_001288 [Verrucomicrobiota bacterium]